MCGIFGYSFRERPDSLEAFAALLAVQNDNRGGQGWGIFGPGFCEKGLGRMGGSVKPSQLASHLHLVGHTRFRTVGEVNVKNSHPFRFGSIVGCHNGAIYNWDELEKQDPRGFKVDSHRLIYQIATGKDLKELTGYGAVAYMDDGTPGTIYFAKLTAGGELALVETPQGVAWSSNRTHLENACKVAGWAEKELTFMIVEPGQRHVVRNGEVTREEGGRPFRLSLVGHTPSGGATGRSTTSANAGRTSGGGARAQGTTSGKEARLSKRARRWMRRRAKERERSRTLRTAVRHPIHPGQRLDKAKYAEGWWIGKDHFYSLKSGILYSREGEEVCFDMEQDGQYPSVLAVAELLHEITVSEWPGTDTDAIQEEETQEDAHA